MQRKQTVEDYLKTIYLLSLSRDVRGSDIAASMNVSRPTVSVCLKSLEKSGYLVMDNSHVVHLTMLGRKIAEEIYDRHRTFLFCLERLGIDHETAAKDACLLEHAVSPQSYYALKNFLVKNLDGGDSCDDR